MLSQNTGGGRARAAALGFRELEDGGMCFKRIMLVHVREEEERHREWNGVWGNGV